MRGKDTVRSLGGRSMASQGAGRLRIMDVAEEDCGCGFERVLWGGR